MLLGATVHVDGWMVGHGGDGAILEKEMFGGEPGGLLLFILESKLN